MPTASSASKKKSVTAKPQQQESTSSGKKKTPQQQQRPAQQQHQRRPQQASTATAAAAQQPTASGSGNRRTEIGDDGKRNSGGSCTARQSPIRPLEADAISRVASSLAAALSASSDNASLAAEGESVPAQRQGDRKARSPRSSPILDTTDDSASPPAQRQHATTSATSTPAAAGPPSTIMSSHRATSNATQYQSAASSMSTDAPTSLEHRLSTLDFSAERVQSFSLHGPSELFFYDSAISTPLANDCFTSLVEDLLPLAHQRQVGSWLEPRKVVWFGPAYTYSGKTIPANEEWHPTVRALRDWLVDSLSTGPTYMRVPRINSCLVNFYLNGAHGVGWHSDDEPELGPDPRIASISLGQQREFLLRTKRDQRIVFRQGLPHGSLVIMGAGVQKNLEHSIPKTSASCGIRINLTFRFTQPCSAPSRSRSAVGEIENDAPVSALFGAMASRLSSPAAAGSSENQVSEGAGLNPSVGATNPDHELEEGEVAPTQEAAPRSPPRRPRTSQRARRIVPVLFDVPAGEICGVAFERFLKDNFPGRPAASVQRQFHGSGFVVHPLTEADHAAFLTQDLTVPYRGGVEVGRRQPRRRDTDARDPLCGSQQPPMSGRQRAAGRRSHCFVIRNVPLCTDLKELQDYLNSTQGFTINGVLRVVAVQTGLPTLLVRAFTNSAAQVEAAVEQGVRLGYQLHRCEHSRGRPTTPPLQCTNCRAFGHPGSRCAQAARCNRCGGPHRQDDCNAEQELCVNCGGPHRAGFKQCPAAQEARRRQDERRQQQSQQRGQVDQRSYAAAAAPAQYQPPAQPLGFPPMPRMGPRPHAMEVMDPPGLAEAPTEPASSGSRRRHHRHNRHNRRFSRPPQSQPQEPHQPVLAPSAAPAATSTSAATAPVQPQHQQPAFSLSMATTMVVVITQVLQELLTRPREDISAALIAQTVTSAMALLLRADGLSGGRDGGGEIPGSGRSSPDPES